MRRHKLENVVGRWHEESMRLCFANLLKLSNPKFLVCRMRIFQYPRVPLFLPQLPHFFRNIKHLFRLLLEPFFRRSGVISTFPSILRRGRDIRRVYRFSFHINHYHLPVCSYDRLAIGA